MAERSWRTLSAYEVRHQQVRIIFEGSLYIFKTMISDISTKMCRYLVYLIPIRTKSCFPIDIYGQGPHRFSQINIHAFIHMLLQSEEIKEYATKNELSV